MLNQVSFLKASLLSLAALFLTVSEASAQNAGTDSARAAASIPQQLDLKQAEEIALSRNLGLIAARYQIDAARADRLTASLRPNPVFSAANENFKFSQPSFGANGAFVEYTGRVDWLLETGGKRRLRMLAADRGVAISEARFQDEARRLLLRVRQAFYNALLAGANLGLANDDLENFQRIAAISKVRFEAGDAAQVDLLRIELEREQLLTAVKSAELARERALVELTGLLGQRVDPQATPQAPAIVLTGALAAPPLELELDRLKQFALQRPDVIAAKMSVEASQNLLQLAQAGRRQDFTAFTQYRRKDGFDTFGFGFSIPIPLFNRNQGVIERAQAVVTSDRSALGQAELDALVEVEKAFRSYETSLAEMQRYRDSLAEKATRVRRIIEMSYQEGHASLLELLDATRTYNQIRLAQTRAEFAYRMSLIELEAATGRSLIG